MKPINLDITLKTIDELKAGFGTVVTFLEEGGSLNLSILEELKTSLSRVIASH
ncbi:MAG: hypothetical protein GY754_04390, partial [bacterium]|nr:hypothetical protein [bacterium]